MMHGDEKSDPAIVAVKPANKSGQLDAAVNRARADLHSTSTNPEILSLRQFLCAVGAHRHPRYSTGAAQTCGDREPEPASFAPTTGTHGTGTLFGQHNPTQCDSAACSALRDTHTAARNSSANCSGTEHPYILSKRLLSGCRDSCVASRQCAPVRTAKSALNELPPVHPSRFEQQRPGRPIPQKRSVIA